MTRPRTHHRSRSGVLCAALLAWCAPSLAQETGGVSPTAPQAEDSPDVGDRGDAPKAAAPSAPEAPANTSMDDSSLKARYEALRDMVRAFEREAKETRDEVRRIAERKYKERRNRIEDNYRRAIEPHVTAERSKRLDAIAAFEAFLERHPNDKEFTPDAMFRLAELYFEKYDDEYQLASKEYKEQFKLWQEAGSKGDAPLEPQKRFDKTIALYERLIRDYPDYRLVDGAYYLLGYTQRAQGDTQKGVGTWMTLVQRFPQSRFYAEVWFRIGDSHFDEERWDDAIAAFLNVTPLKDSDYYDKALYKLAWTYYLVNRFDDSVGRFFELLDFSYGKRDQGDEQGSVLEEESIQYVAISFGDDNWKRPDFSKLVSGKSLDDPDAEVAVDYVAHAEQVFKKAGEAESPEVKKARAEKANKTVIKDANEPAAAEAYKPFERDVMARLGNNLFKQSKHEQAVKALERAIALDPMHRDAPKLQDLIVQAWVRERQFDKANTARDMLVKNYGDQSAWAKRYGNDSEALTAARDLARTNLYSAALYYHQQATQYFNDNRQDLGVQYFKAASEAYKKFLERYPHDKNAYELSYYLAETYYYSLRFDEALKQYEAVRDSPAGTKYRAEAGLATVYSYEKVIDQAVQSGTLEKKEIFAGAARDPNAKPQEIPDLRKRYIEAIDKFLEGGKEHEMAPAFGYRAGEVLYAYGHFDEAVKRFELVVDRYPDTEAARFAANLILDDMLARKDWKAAAEYASRFEDAVRRAGGTEEEIKKIGKVKSGAKFNIAKETLEQGEKLLNDGRIQEGQALLEEGANKYLALIAEDPKREFADSMMFNAALSLEKARRPLKAAELYERLYKEYPGSEHAPDAMFRVAAKNEDAFQFDKAVSTYLQLVKQYPKAPQRADAQVNAALALEGMQQYERAAQELERFAVLFPERPDAPEVFFRASVVHQKRKAPGAELDVLQRFIKKYGGNAAQAPKVIEAYTRIGEIEKDADKPKQATEAYQAAVRNFKNATGSQAAAYFAAKSAFALAEQSYQGYARLGIVSKNAKVQTKELTAKSERLKKVEDELKQIITTYKQAEWSLAALYRIGSLYDNLQQTVLKSPCPDDVRRIAGEIACDEYRNAIEDQAFAVEQKAVDAYKTAFDKAKELRVQNEWTKKTLEALNLLRPQEYPIDKEPVSRPQKSAATTAIPAVLPDGGAQELKNLGPGPGEQAFKVGT